MRNEYKELKRENDLIFSTLAEYDRDTITDIIGTIDNRRGTGYDVELVRKDLIAMAAQAETQGRILTDTIGDTELFKRNLLASMPKPKLTDYMADSMAWLALYGFMTALTYLILGGAWECHYDAVWLVLCVIVLTPSAWLLQRLIPTSWLAETDKGVRYTLTVVALLVLCFVEIRLLYRWLYPILPHVGLPNVVAVVLFAVLALALRAWRTARCNKLAAARPWREITK